MGKDAKTEVTMNVSELLGEWESAILNTELGRARVRVTFAPKEEVSVVMRYLDAPPGSEMSTSGKYEIDEHERMVSVALFKGRAAKVVLDGKVLVLHPDGGEPLKLSRAEAAG